MAEKSLDTEKGTDGPTQQIAPHDNLRGVAMGVNGRATIIDPNIPEPTAHTGRNYIDLKLPPDGGDWFVHDTPVTSEGILAPPQAGTVQAAQPQAVSGEAVLSLIVGAAGVLRLKTAPDPDGATRFQCNVPMSAKLTSLTTDDVLALTNAGKQVILRRSMYGTMTYEVVSAGRSPATAPPVSAGSVPAGPISGAHAATPAPQETNPPDCSISWSPDGSSSSEPTFSGAAPLNIPPLYGTATPVPDASNDVKSLKLWLDPQPWPPSPNKPPTGASKIVDILSLLDANGNWQTTIGQGGMSVSQGGSHRIALQAVAKDGGTSWGSVQFNAVIGTDKPPNPPSLSVTTPSDNARITAPALPMSVPVRGSASTNADGATVVSVSIALDGSTTVIGAQPGQGNNWSAWTATVSVPTEGQHSLTVRCVDSKGGSTQQSVTFYTAVKRAIELHQRLLLVETYRLSSFLGRYGAGRTLKTFTLLPGETTTISVRTFNKVDTTSKSASSILDSFTDESATAFENTLAEEQHHEEATKETFNYHVDGQANANWGWGSAQIKAGVKGGTDSSRDQFAKTTSSALQKHTSSASAKRDVNITTEYTATSDIEGETKTERTIKNINVSRVLNFVFRQMNQEICTLLHLVDLRLAHYKEEQFSDGSVVTSYREATIPEMDSLLRGVVAQGNYTLPQQQHNSPWPSGSMEKWIAAKFIILENMHYISDYLGNLQPFLEHVVKTDPDGNTIDYWHVNPTLTMSYTSSTTKEIFGPVPGVIVNADVQVMRTEGVIADALLGDGQALDDYSQALQKASVGQRNLANQQTQADIDKAQLAITIVKAKDEAQAKIYAEVYPPPEEESEVEVTAGGNSKPKGANSPA